VTIGLDDFVGNQPIMIKVAFTSGGGNNAFLDDFNLDVTLDQKDLTAAQISIYPNPSSGRFTVEGAYLPEHRIPFTVPTVAPFKKVCWI
jgi:hypothetical protein